MLLFLVQASADGADEQAGGVGQESACPCLPSFMHVTNRKVHSGLEWYQLVAGDYRNQTHFLTLLTRMFGHIWGTVRECAFTCVLTQRPHHAKSSILTQILPLFAHKREMGQMVSTLTSRTIFRFQC
jgi:hypothetical protein